MTPDYRVANRDLAPRGAARIAWAESQMPVLMGLRAAYAPAAPLKGHRVACCAHATKETAVLIRTLLDSGAEVSWTGGNAQTTQDDVAAAVVNDGARVFAWRGMSPTELAWGIAQTVTSLPPAPTMLIDDGADLICMLHAQYPECASHLLGAVEKTSSGVKRLRAMAAAEHLLFPVINVNDVVTKWEYDNTFGTGQSTIDGILRASNILLAGKTFVVAGFGHVGRGVALRAIGMGAHVIVTCVRATTALKALYQGFRVMPMLEAARIGNVFCTATGGSDVISRRHLDVMKDGAILCNSGHSDREISRADLGAITAHSEEVRPHTVRHTLRDGRALYVLGDGGLVNLAAAEGNPSEVMDLSFAHCFLAALTLAGSGRPTSHSVHDLSDAQDQQIARLKLATMGIHIDEWTEEQRRYATGYTSGT